MVLSYPRITLLQKQQMNSCFLSSRRVYNRLNIEKIDFVSTLIPTSSQIKHILQLPCIFLYFSSNWPFHCVITSCNPVYLFLALANFLCFHSHCRGVLLFPLRILFLYPACLHLIYISSSSFKALPRLWLHLLNSGHFLLWSGVFVGREMLCLLAPSPHPRCQEMRANHSCPKDFVG